MTRPTSMRLASPASWWCTPRGDGTTAAGALFVINARGEPQEFTYSRLDIPHPHAVGARRTCAAISSGRWCRRCSTPVRGSRCCCSPAPPTSITTSSGARSCPASPWCAWQPKAQIEPADGAEAVARLELTWYPAAPRPDTAERRLMDELTARGLLLEPFERADRGLDEVVDPESWTEHGAPRR
ncbi:MAG: hypothetical protein U0531_17305 [Dehalococcoidia bacterium]